MNIWSVSHDMSPPIAMIGHKDMAGSYGAPIVYYDGQRLAGQWKVPETMFYVDASRSVITDFPFHAHGILCCRTSIVPALLELLARETEVLPLHVEGASFSLLNVINVVDALDKEHC